MVRRRRIGSALHRAYIDCKIWAIRRQYRGHIKIAIPYLNYFDLSTLFTKVFCKGADRYNESEAVMAIIALLGGFLILAMPFKVAYDVLTK